MSNTDRIMGQDRARLRVSPVAVLALAVVAAFAVSLCVGSADISLAHVFAGLTGTGDAVTNAIIRDIRLPRAILSLAVGAVLGCSGAALQGYLRNPLAEPAILGTSNAAALGAVVSLYYGAAHAFALALPLMAAGFALVAMVLLLLLARQSQTSLTLILSGIALSAVGGALTSLMLNLSSNPFAVLEITFWLLGAVEDRSMTHVYLAVPLIAVGMVLMMWDRRAYDALSLGEETAQSLGFSLNIVRVRLIIGVAIGVGGAVAVSGAIGFVGLVIPHLVRLWIGPQPSRLLVPSALLGAVVLTAADILVRLIPSTNELKLGVITSLIGAPFLLHLMMYVRRRMD